MTLTPDSIRLRIQAAFKELDAKDAKYDWLRWFLDSPKKQPVRTPRKGRELAFFLSRILGTRELTLFDTWQDNLNRRVWWYGVLAGTCRYTPQELKAVLYG